MPDYTTAPDPADPAVTLLTLGAVTFRVRGADQAGAIVAPAWTSQIDQIAAGLALIPATHHVHIAPSEIRVAMRPGGCAFDYASDRITLGNQRFAATWNQRTFQSLVHECGHSYDKRRHCTERLTREQPAGVERERVWQVLLPRPITRWTAASPTFPPASPRDDWDHFRAIDYRGQNHVRETGLPTPGESFAEGFMMVLCNPSRRATADQARIIRNLAAL